MCLNRRSDIPTVCLQKLSDNDSCIRIEVSWLVDHLEVCLEEGAKERSEFLIFRDTFASFFLLNQHGNHYPTS